VVLTSIYLERYKQKAGPLQTYVFNKKERKKEKEKKLMD